MESIDLELLVSADVIAIDEAQFFGDELVPFVRKLVDSYHKYVIVGGLDGNYKRQKFGHVLDLLPLADNVTKLHAYCKPCSTSKTLRAAIFTHYIGDLRDTLIVGGADDYQPVCRRCYLKLTDYDKNNEELKLLELDV